MKCKLKKERLAGRTPIQALFEELGKESEKCDDYIWALERFKDILDPECQSSVIVYDRELALMNVIMDCYTPCLTDEGNIGSHTFHHSYSDFSRNVDNDVSYSLKSTENQKQKLKNMVKTEHPRLILHQFISPDLCKELEFIHKSCSTTGYRPNVFSTTLSHLIATNSSHLIVPFVSIRERLKEKVEEFFGCEFELFIEFTGLISWTRGASIGWHSDDNRPYLKQRHFAAVCYLNSYGTDFEGGLFHFQHGEPASVVPMTGDVLIYTADSRNIHSVDEIIDGERLTLTLWFTRDASHDEDAKLISFLSRTLLDSSDTNFDRLLPSPASNNMYWFPPDQASNYQSGFDLRCARIYINGYDIHCSQDKSYSLADNSFDNFLELLNEPLQLSWRNQLLKKEFANILHALQVLQFYYWKRTECQPSEYKVHTDDVVQMSESQSERIQNLKLLFVKNYQSVETIFTHRSSGKSLLEQSIDWASFSAANLAWEAYTSKLHQEILISYPEWIIHHSIFSNPSKES